MSAKLPPLGTSSIHKPPGLWNEIDWHLFRAACPDSIPGPIPLPRVGPRIEIEPAPAKKLEEPKP